MARTISTIQITITAAYVTAAAAVGITIDPTQWSRRGITQVFMNAYATVQAIAEQLYDAFIAQNETIVTKAASSTAAWIQNKFLSQFQYSATVAQNLLLDTTGFFYYYATVDPTLNIITRCAVLKDATNAVVDIKVATGTTPTQLTTLQLAAAQQFINIVGTAGITYVVSSIPSDKIMIQADVRYNTLYSGTINNDVISAINAFLATQSAQPNFGGTIKLSDLLEVIRNVTGVNDVLFNNVSARQDSTPYASATPMVTSYDWVLRQWQTVSGYIVAETTTGHTLTDTLNFIAE